MTDVKTSRPVMPGNQAMTESPATSLADAAAAFHRLNNQLGIILANAELLEARLPTEEHRARAAQIVSGAVEAISVVRDLRRNLPT